MRKIDEIIIHCTATPEGRPVTVADVNKWHKEKGYNGIGYHYLIGLNGETWEGRPEDMVGAHCINHNTNSIGVCYVGGLDVDGKPKDTRTAKQKISLGILVAELMERYPNASIHGHNEFAAKDCPCFNVKNEF